MPTRKRFLLTINTPPPIPVSLQEITAQYGIGIGNAIGNISLDNNWAQLVFKVHHCPHQLRTISISWQGVQAAKSSSCLWFPRTWRSACSSHAPPWTSPRRRAPSTSGGIHWGSSEILHPGSSACGFLLCSLGRISLKWRLPSKHRIQSQPEILQGEIGPQEKLTKSPRRSMLSGKLSRKWSLKLKKMMFDGPFLIKIAVRPLKSKRC